MWEVITKLEPPAPPIPQPPYEEVDNYLPYNDLGQTNLDDIFQDPRYADFKVSYCPFLMDPREHGYDWVDITLRNTIFRCCK